MTYLTKYLRELDSLRFSSQHTFRDPRVLKIRRSKILWKLNAIIFKNNKRNKPSISHIKEINFFLINEINLSQINEILR